ncbi:BofC C-terminal domain-containing protein [Paenibacillus chibensis]|uniref:BofC C-terminal domain-containing protein n=1 Tax=Paenibacillus chibensis TaxID=59846 RepID=A0ABU6Q224_9BACL|nr:BofC C-terminal domain-containing protein [Paenibacillus chibensis]MEC0369651.1 BofC C-terminal domain-containing protein [Paenibacillus chibensis]MED5020478.1 BofC C-terminal domain-containing protein [Paenibacillus chibensis]
MNATRIKKKLQKQWRRWKRRSLTLGLSSLVIAVVWVSMYLPDKVQHLLSAKPPVAVETLQYYQQVEEAKEDAKEDANFWKELNKIKQVNEVIVRHSYVCGEEERALGRLNTDEIYNLLNEHPTWKGQFEGQGKVVLNETILDLSPTCKQRAYMSMDKDGNLSLFDGPPEQDKVIKTFFQLDISSMESTLPDDALRHLYDGIRIQDIDEYNSVLSTFSDYARKG